MGKKNSRKFGSLRCRSRGKRSAFADSGADCVTGAAFVQCFCGRVANFIAQTGTCRFRERSRTALSWQPWRFHKVFLAGAALEEDKQLRKK